jgi:RNA 2',3'-cyclic 3'-phosphodiesterase
MDKRLFLAIKLPHNYIENFQKISQENGFRGIRWTNLNNLHLTIYFLGDVKEENLPELEKQLQVIQDLHVFSLKFNKITLAPPNHSPRMIWVQFYPQENFDKLNQIIYQATKNISHQKPNLKQIPHITLARFKNLVDYEKITLPHLKLNDLKIQKIELMSSLLTSQGAWHTTISNFVLQYD